MTSFIERCLHATLVCSLLLGAGCSEAPGTDGGPTGDAHLADDGARGDGAAGDPAAGDPTLGDPAAGDRGAGDPEPGDTGAGDPGPLSFTVVTFNTGTTDGLLHDLARVELAVGIHAPLAEVVVGAAALAFGVAGVVGPIARGG